MKRVAFIAASAALLLASAVGSASAQNSTTTAPSAASAPVLRAIPVPFGAQGWDNCQHGQACLFQNSNGGGTMYFVPSCGQIYNLDSSINNRTSSLWNRAGSPLSVYDGTGGSGLLAAYGAFGPTINVPSNFNDKISSVYAPADHVGPAPLTGRRSDEGRVPPHLRGRHPAQLLVDRCDCAFGPFHRHARNIDRPCQ